MAKKRKKPANKSNLSTRSNSPSNDSDFVSIDDKKYSKNEIKDYVCELKDEVLKQNDKINKLSATVNELKEMVQSRIEPNSHSSPTKLSLIDSQNETNRNNNSEAVTNSKANDSHNATISDCDDDNFGNMDTDSITDALLNTEHADSAQFSINNDLDLLRARNRALLSSDTDKNNGSTEGGQGTAKASANVSKTNTSTNKEVHLSISSNRYTYGGRSNNNNNKATVTQANGNPLFISNPQSSAETAKPNKFKVNKKISPEIIVFNINNKKETLDHLKSILGHDRVMFRFINKDKTAIITENNMDRKKILDFLNNNYSRYFTFTPSNEKPINFLLKYIDCSFDEADIRNDILSLNKDVKILNLKVFETTKPLVGKKIWLLQIENNEKAKSLAGKQKLCASIVTFDKLKNSGILQCKRCQRFGHSAINCHNTYRCVKCGKEESQKDSAGVLIGHKFGECPLNLQQVNGSVDPQNLFCCNCKKAGHPANYTKCEKFLEQINKRDLKAERTVEKKVMFNNYISSGLSFADQIKSNPGSTNNTKNQNSKQKSPQLNSDSNLSHQSGSSSNPNNNNFIQSECEKHFGENLFCILSKINDFVPKYKKFNDNQKSIKLLEFLFNLSSQNAN
jgi:hypothetical protein